MSSTPDWTRPSSLLLAVVIAANLTLPVIHFGPPWPHGAAEPKPVAARPAPALSVRMDPVPPVMPAEQASFREPPTACRAWGPFTDVSEAESVAARLGFAAAGFELFASEIHARPDYVVTVRAPGSRDAAERIMKELESQNIESYILERGPDGSRLSVGVFSSEPRAEAQRQRVVELGYEANLEPLERSHQVYHLMARVPPDLEPEIPAVAACGDIAPLNQFL